MLCPVSELCAGRQQGQPEKYPVKTRKLKRTAQSLWLLQARSAEGSVWLEKRPPTGIWAGLYCLPVFESREALQACVPHSIQAALRDDAAFMHVLTHRDLHLHPVAGEFGAEPLQGREGAWFGVGEWTRLGLPAPIRRLLEARQ